MKFSIPRILVLTLLVICTVVLLPSLIGGVHQDDHPKALKIGDAVPNLEQALLNVDGEYLSLKDIAAENGLLVNFSCNTCPFVVAWEDRYPAIEEACKAAGIGYVLVNSNEAKRSGDDSAKAMQLHAKENNYSAPYVIDEYSKLADAFGAFKTPEVFLFDSNLQLVYKGAIDDNFRSKEEAKESYLLSAISNLFTGKEINPAVTAGRGCSIKRLQ